uniref:Uncharacterized protein n=1 Tax=Oryza sativa subsp. japonica TaxID=39947 RepID=Q6ZIU1_ORYSJ|nr:hypothetical protein [Oryza sativa Japonica Group]
MARRRGVEDPNWRSDPCVYLLPPWCQRPLCLCGDRCQLMASRNPDIQGRRFFRCPNYDREVAGISHPKVMSNTYREKRLMNDNVVNNRATGGFFVCPNILDDDFMEPPRRCQYREWIDTRRVLTPPSRVVQLELPEQYRVTKARSRERRRADGCGDGDEAKGSGGGGDGGGVEAEVGERRRLWRSGAAAAAVWEWRWRAAAMGRGGSGDEAKGSSGGGDEVKGSGGGGDEGKGRGGGGDEAKGSGGDCECGERRRVVVAVGTRLCGAAAVAQARARAQRWWRKHELLLEGRRPPPPPLSSASAQHPPRKPHLLPSAPPPTAAAATAPLGLVPTATATAAAPKSYKGEREGRKRGMKKEREGG